MMKIRDKQEGFSKEALLLGVKQYYWGMLL